MACPQWGPQGQWREGGCGVEGWGHQSSPAHRRRYPHWSVAGEEGRGSRGAVVGQRGA